MDADKRERGAATARAVGRGAVVGAVAAVPWGVFVGYFFDDWAVMSPGLPSVVYFTFMFLEFGALAGMVAVIGFRFITGKL
jgi:hypothetical protein